MGKDSQAYFLQRAAEEMAAAERATNAAAASAHSELSLRYSLKLVLPEDTAANDDTRTIGRRRRVPERRTDLPVHEEASQRRSG